MALSIKDSTTDRLARELARRTGTTLTGAINAALEAELKRVKARKVGRSLYDELMALGERNAALPVLDDASEDEILGLDKDGIPLPPRT